MEVTREIKDMNQNDTHRMRPYILALKEKEHGVSRCERCIMTNIPLDVHHKRYGLDVNYYDLEILCEPCHKKETWG